MKVDGPSKMDDSDQILLSFECESNVKTKKEPYFSLKTVHFGRTLHPKDRQL